MRKLLAFITFLIIYGSLYPFEFRPQAFEQDDLDNLLSFGISQSGRGDMIANVLLFIPFGLVAMWAGRSNSFAMRWVTILGGGFFLAYAIQVAQLVIPGRVPAGSDAVWNLIGCFLGGYLGRIRPPTLSLEHGITGNYRYLFFAIALGWVIWHWAPFIPSLDLQLIKDNLKQAFNFSSASPLWIFQGITIWLLVFHFLREAGGRFSQEKYFPALVFITLLLSFGIVGNRVSADDIFSAVFAVPLWFLVRKMLRPAALILLLVTLIIGINFTPFELRQQSSVFSWVPFSGALHGNLLLNVLAILKKLLLYSSLILLLIQTNFRVRTATLLVAAFLFVNEYAQIYFHNATAEITDALVALALGVGIYLVNQELVKSGTVTNAQQIRASAAPMPSPTTSHAVNANHIPAMAGLRAIAALAVFFVHFDQKVGLQASYGAFDLSRFLSNGNTGVALFFTLSGLLLSIGFWQAKINGAKTPSMKDYAWRRAARILPAYYFCLFAIIAAKSIAGSGTSWNNILSHLVFVYNISDWNILSLNQPFWTLAAEVQFYILLPLIFLALTRVSARATFWIIASLIPLLYFANFSLITSLQNYDQWPINQLLLWPFALHIEGPTSFVMTYSTLGHLPHFLLGVLGARLFLKLVNGQPASRFKQSTCELLLWGASAAIFLILATPLDDIIQLPYGRYNFPVVPILLTIAVVCVPFTRVARRLLDSALLVWLGTISYGIYIYHYPIQKIIARGAQMVGMPAPDHPLVFAVVALILTLIASQLSYTWLELPAIRWVRRRLAGSAETAVETAVETTLATTSEPLDSPPTPPSCKTAPLVDAPPILTISVNFTRPQASFLLDFANNFAVTPSVICQELIDANTRSSEDLTDNILFQAFHAGIAVKPEQKQPSQQWMSLSIELETDHLNQLAKLGAGNGDSVSKTLRKMLSEYMMTLPNTTSDTRSHVSKVSKHRRRLLLLAAFILIALALGLWRADSGSSLEGPAWAGHKATIVFDHHTHTDSSDGALKTEELVKLAFSSGCDALAITDHSRKSGAASKEQLSIIGRLREQYPEKLLFGGVELNIPSYKGREHANLIVHPSQENQALRLLADMAENSIKNIDAGADKLAEDTRFMQAISIQVASPEDRVMIYNHPSRKSASAEDILNDILRWKNQQGPITAISGAPGHQNTQPLGSYREPLLTEDRWDPATAQIGGVWDQLWDRGNTLWGAIASSDYHNSNLDFAPCAFSRIHVAVPERSYSGVLDGLNAGTFWADHGRILNQLWFSAEVEGLKDTAYPGSTLLVGDTDSTAIISLSIERGPGSLGAPLNVEIIGNCATGKPQLLASQTLGFSEITAVTLLPLAASGSDGESCFIRARVRLEQVGQPDLLGYTNPIRFRL